MLAEEETLIGRIDNYRIVQLARIFQIFHQSPDTFIYRDHRCQIVAHILLVFPAHQFLPFQIAFPVLRYPFRVNGIPFALHVFRHPLVNLRQSVGRVLEQLFTRHQLQVPVFRECLRK